MKKITVFIILMLFSVAFVFAQGKKAKKTPEEKATKLTDEMATVMGLSADQKTKVYDANLKQIKDLADIKAEVKSKYPDKASRKANKDAIKTTYGPQKKAVRKARKDAIKAAGVSDEQWKKWKAHKKEKKGKKGKGKGKN